MNNIWNNYTKIINDYKTKIRNHIFGYDKKYGWIGLICGYKNLYIITKNGINKYTLNKSISTKFIKGTPNGAFQLSIPKQVTLNLINIKHGRVFDFLQDVNPKRIYKATYDNTARLQNGILSTPEHAQYIDNLRYAMEKGQISQHDYDSLNPILSKAGK